MNKLILSLIGFGAMISMSANASFYDWTDFDKTRISYTLSGFQSSHTAESAAVQSFRDLHAGRLPARMIHWNRDRCRNVNDSIARRAISNYIVRRGQYARVQTYGFSISSRFDRQGNEIFSAHLKARIPCLKANNRRDDD